ncbi:MAG: RNA-binding protein [Bdellovibrionota bacterium]
MAKKLFVGNLPFSITEATLTEAFSACGSVESAKIVTDRDTGRSKGFGFVEMSTEEEATQAISKLNNAELEGRAISVSEARPQAPRTGGGGGRSAGGGRGGYSGGGGGRGGYGGGGGNRY